MVSSTGAQRGALRVAVATALVATLAGAGCGSEEFPNEPRAPAPITVSAVIAPRGVTVSRARFGAGPVELLASNQTPTSQRLQLRSLRLAAGGASLAQTTGPINPGGTASLHADVDAGTYLVSVRSSAIEPARVVVSAQRAGARDRLLQP